MYLLGEFFGLAALWFAFPIAEVLTMLFAVSLAVRELRAISRTFSERDPEKEAAR
jgi:Na+-driven multidrug efflux pump